VSDPSETFATPRVAAGALFFDDAGRVLLVHPTYKDTWDIPGGYVERGESPAAACRRELQEELGLDRKPVRLLAVDWAPNEGEGDKLLSSSTAEISDPTPTESRSTVMNWTAGCGSSYPSSTTTSSRGSPSGSGQRWMGTARSTWSTVYLRRDH
jgi:ADP-ribose pyrophosphatase YjhB (NUDIX family)